MKRIFRAMCILLTFLAPALQAQTGPILSPQELVQRLGNESFAVREDAFQRLRQLGQTCEQELREGAKSANPEIRLRSQELLTLLSRSNLETRIQQFLQPPSSSSAASLPGWQSYRVIVGANADQRKQFVELYRGSTQLFADYEAEPGQSAAVLHRWTQTLHDRFFQDPAKFSLMEVNALLCLAQDSPVAQPTFAEMQDLLHSIAFGPVVQKQFKDKKDSQKIVSAFLKTSTAPSHLEKSLDILCMLKAADGPHFAWQVIRKTDNPARVRARAILALGEFDDRSGLLELEKLLSNATPVGEKKFRGKILHTQIGDVALAMLIHLHGKNVAKFGFPYHEAIPGQVLHVAPECFGFATDEDRQKALAQWNGERKQ
jgi:hypothetical protein